MEGQLIDAHYWYVDKKGKIIDPFFEEYETKQHIRDTIIGPKGLVYLPADPEIQKRYMEERLKHHYPQDMSYGKLGALPAVNMCSMNSIWELVQDKGQGKIVFGSLGYRRKDGSIWWELGSPRAKKVEDFIQGSPRNKAIAAIHEKEHKEYKERKKVPHHDKRFAIKHFKEDL